MSNKASSCTARHSRPVSSLTSRTTAPAGESPMSHQPPAGPEPVAALLHQQEMTVIVLNKGPHIQLRGGIATIQGNPLGDGVRFQITLTGNEGDRCRSQRLEAGDIEGIVGVGESGLGRDQHLFQKGGQRRLHG